MANLHYTNLPKSSFINVPFLNLLANIVERAGRIHIRLGGNTQETASLVDHLDGGHVIEKDKTNTTGTVSPSHSQFCKTDRSGYLA